MREILFIGKRKDNGEWVEGRLLANDVIVPSGQSFILEANCIYGCDKPIIAYDVDKETVGQYTGLTDKNGKKIFEGDIVRYNQTDGAKWNGKPIICTGKVVYNDKTASFAVNSIDEIGTKNYDYFPIKNIEVIGNIHDNPELLEVEE